MKAGKSFTCRCLTGLATTLALGVLLLGTPTISSAQVTFTNLMDFNNTDGADPYYVYLVQGTDGQLYGTAGNGGGKGVGTAYKITTDGGLTQLYSFCVQTACADGELPYAGLVMAANGNFYGTTTCTNNCSAGYSGTIFEITPSGSYSVLHTFAGTDGSGPYTNMVLGSDGNLYGTTLYGGNLSLCEGLGCGTVFKITPSGKFTSLYSFAGAADGGWPIGKLFQGSNGSFLGTTIGANGSAGTVFQITPTGKLTTLYNFCALASCTDGDAPYGGVIQTSTGAIYGTTAGGGNGFSAGTIFKLVGKKLTTLYDFCSQPGCTDGSTPYAGLIQASDGNFYGTTLSGGADNGGANNAGTVFELTSGGTFNSLYAFCSQPGCADGIGPYGGGLLQATDGSFYGTTFQGGDVNYSYGTIFSISVGLGPFVQTTTSAGKVAAKVTILGTNLTGATAVSFNGTAATLNTVTSSEIITTVPSGATTGKITVTTPSRTLSTNVAFKVIPQITSFSPGSGSVGTQVTITGVSLTQTSKVTFGGVAASFTVNSDGQVTATVPTGAGTGKIVITTPGGTAASSTSFTVT